MNIRQWRASSLAIVALAACGNVVAGGTAEGAVVIHDHAPVYADSTGDATDWKAFQGQPVAGMTSGFTDTYQFEEANGRVHVFYYDNKNQKGVATKTAWMNPADLQRFTYKCGCEDKGREACRPTAGDWDKQTWNTCFHEAADPIIHKLKKK